MAQYHQLNLKKNPKKLFFTDLFFISSLFIYYMCLWSLLSPAGVKGKCCSEDGFGGNTNCPGDAAVSAG